MRLFPLHLRPAIHANGCYPGAIRAAEAASWPALGITAGEGFSLHPAAAPPTIASKTLSGMGQAHQKICSLEDWSAQGGRRSLGISKIARGKEKKFNFSRACPVSPLRTFSSGRVCLVDLLRNRRQAPQALPLCARHPSFAGSAPVYQSCDANPRGEGSLCRSSPALGWRSGESQFTHLKPARTWAAVGFLPRLQGHPHFRSFSQSRSRGDYRITTWYSNSKATRLRTEV